MPNVLKYYLTFAEIIHKRNSLVYLLEIDQKKVLQKITFTHPYFEQDALNNQKLLKEIQNKRNVLFCGSYFGYGFHEDGIKSSINMIENLND